VTALFNLRLAQTLIDTATQEQIESADIFCRPSRFNNEHWYVALTAKLHHPNEVDVVLADARVAAEEEALELAANIKDICLLAKGVT